MVRKDTLCFNILWMWCSMFTDLCILSHACTSGKNSIWLGLMTFLMCCWIQFASILLGILASIFIREIGLSSSFLLYLCLVLELREWWLYSMSLEGFPPFQLSGIVWEELVLLLPLTFGRIQQKPSGLFCFGILSLIQSHSWLLICSGFLCDSILVIMFLEIFLLSFSICWHIVVHNSSWLFVFPWDPF